MKNYLLGLISFFLLTYSSCEKKENCNVSLYHFDIPSIIEEPSDTFFIGDTIHISIKYSTRQLVDLNTNNEINIGNFDMGIGFGVTDFTDSVDNFGINSFDVIEEVGGLVQNNLVGVSVYKIKFKEIEANNESAFKLIPNKKGKFLFGFSTTIDSDQKEKVNILGTPCGEIIDEISFKINGGVENGYDFYVDNIGLPYSEITFEEYTRAGAFAFSVE